MIAHQLFDIRQPDDITIFSIQRIVCSHLSIYSISCPFLRRHISAHISEKDECLLKLLKLDDKLNLDI